MKSHIAKLAFVAALMCLPQFVNAQWSAPTATPPNNNASTPINVSNTGQVKLGGLTLNTGGAQYGLIVSQGSVGIGTAGPAYKLDVIGDIINTGWLRTRGNTGWYSETYGGGWHMTDSTWVRSYSSKSVYMAGGFDTANPAAVACSGGLGAGYNFRVCGTANVTTSIHSPAFYYSSDMNLKKDIETLGPSESLANILKLEGVSFSWKDQSHGVGKNIGLIAQDVEKVYPELVNTDEKTGLKSVEYGNLVAPLIEAIKEQQKHIEKLKIEVEALKAAR